MEIFQPAAYRAGNLATPFKNKRFLDPWNFFVVVVKI